MYNAVVNIGPIEEDRPWNMFVGVWEKLQPLQLQTQKLSFTDSPKMDGGGMGNVPNSIIIH